MCTTVHETHTKLKIFLFQMSHDHHMITNNTGNVSHGMHMAHHGMDHGGMTHDSMDHGSMDHGSMDHASMDHGSMNYGSMSHGMQHNVEASTNDACSGMGMHGMSVRMTGPVVQNSVPLT